MVVALDGQVIAFANSQRWAVNGIGVIGNVIVSPAAHGQGVTRYLITGLIDLACTKHQAAGATLSGCNQKLAGLLRYPKQGFPPWAIEERQGRKGNRAVIHLRLPANTTRHGRAASRCRW